MSLSLCRLSLSLIAVGGGFAFTTLGADLPANRDPVPFRISRPAYPESLQDFRIRGEVKLAFDLDADGYVYNPEIVYATHPDFEKPALDISLSWRYRAARKDGQQVPARWEQTINSDVITKGAEPFNIPATPPDGTPESFRYDQPPSIRTLVQAVYPYELLMAGTNGSADVTFVVGDNGIPHEVTVGDSSHPEFGAALAAAMEAWRFIPAMKAGQPTPAVLKRALQFGFGEEDVLLNPSSRRLRELMNYDSTAVVPSHELDQPLRPRKQPAPVYPEKQTGKDGSATIEFIVDREGRAQLPRIISATEPEFGWSAATAVAQWEFDPPTRQGEPIDTRMRVPIVFKAPPGARTDEAGPEEETPPPAQP